MRSAGQVRARERRVRAVARFLARPRTARDVAEKFGVARATAHRLVGDVEKAGYLVGKCEARRVGQCGPDPEAYFVVGEANGKRRK